MNTDTKNPEPQINTDDEDQRPGPQMMQKRLLLKGNATQLVFGAFASESRARVAQDQWPSTLGLPNALPPVLTLRPVSMP